MGGHFGYNGAMKTKKAHQKSVDFWSDAAATVAAYEDGSDPVAALVAKVKTSREEKVIEV